MSPEFVKKPRHVIKKYKLNRLNFSLTQNKDFHSVWTCANAATMSQLRHEYKICTHLWLLRFNKEDVDTAMIWWYQMHGLNCDYHHLRKVVMPKTYYFTRPYMKAQRAAEYQRRKARQAAKKGGDVRSEQ
jgi:hypothetical protein